MSCSRFIFSHKTLHLQRGQGECWQCSWAIHFVLSIPVLCPVKGRRGQGNNTNKHIYIYAWCQGSSNPHFSLCVRIPPGIKLGRWVAGPEHSVCVAHSAGLASNVVTIVYDCKELSADVSPTLFSLLPVSQLKGCKGVHLHTLHIECWKWIDRWTEVALQHHIHQLLHWTVFRKQTYDYILHINETLQNYILIIVTDIP
jgi:hypothetical protein